MSTPFGPSYAARLEALADADPAAPAWLAFGHEPMRRGDVAALAGTMRRQFADWNIGPGDVVAWPVIDRGMAPLLAVVPAVATLAPLAPVLGFDACSRVYARLGVKAVILPPDAQHAARDAATSMGVAVIESTTARPGTAGALELALAHPAQSLARAPTLGPSVMYVTMTSGTTGRPKLVPHAWGPVAVMAHALGEALAMGADDVSAHLTSLHLANGLRTATMLALLHGGAVDVLPEADVDAFVEAVKAGRVTYTSSSFTMHRELLRRLDGARLATPGRLRFIRVASGRLEPDELDLLEATFGVPVITGLSCTETGSIAHQRLPPVPRRRGSVGGPVASEIRVVDERGHALAAGAVGEVQVRGPQVFGGYIDDAELTASAFVDGWFRLGDLGCLDQAGELEVVGRLGETIDRGGERLSPQEIDTVMLALPGIVDAAAFGMPHPALGEEVVAAVVRARDSTLSATDVIDAVRKQLGDRRAPRSVWFVDALPRTEAGKIEWSALHELAKGIEAPTATVNGSSRASTPLEIALIALWTSSLRRGSIAVDDNFFMLGGDSLRGAKLLMHVNATFGVDIPVHALFDEANTVAGMARRIERERGARYEMRRAVRGACATTCGGMAASLGPRIDPRRPAHDRQPPGPAMRRPPGRRRAPGRPAPS